MHPARTALLLVFLVILWACVGKATADQVPPNYNKAERPDPGGVPTKVSIGLFVIDIADISDVDRQATMDFVLDLWWRDPRLAFSQQASSESVRSFRLQDIWNPHVLIINGRDLKKREEEMVQVDAEGNVHYTQLYFGNLSFDIDLKDFPFDSHVLSIGLVSRLYGPEEVTFIVEPTATGRAEMLSIVDFDIGPGSARTTTYYSPPDRRDYAAFYYDFEAKRHSGFYILKVIVPLCLIIFMSWTVFWIDPSQVGPQIGISTASIFTLIIFQFTLGQQVPRVPYLMTVDYLSLTAIALVFLALVEAIVSVTLVRHGREASALKLDRWSRFAFPAAFFVLAILAFGL